MQRIAMIWLFPSIVIVLLQFAYSYRPRLSIEPNVTVTEGDPASTLFRIINTGPLHLNNIKVTCVIDTSSVKHLMLGSNITIDGAGHVTGNGPISTLDRGATATRDCGAGSASSFVRIAPYDPLSLRLDIVVTYNWPFIPIPDGLTLHFTVRRIADGKTVLVPDVER